MSIGGIPVVLHNELYAIPALVGALVMVADIRMLGLRFGVDAPTPPGTEPKA